MFSNALLQASFHMCETLWIDWEHVSRCLTSNQFSDVRDSIDLYQNMARDADCLLGKLTMAWEQVAPCLHVIKWSKLCSLFALSNNPKMCILCSLLYGRFNKIILVWLKTFCNSIFGFELIDTEPIRCQD